MLVLDVCETFKYDSTIIMSINIKYFSLVSLKYFPDCTCTPGLTTLTRGEDTASSTTLAAMLTSTDPLELSSLQPMELEDIHQTR